MASATSSSFSYKRREYLSLRAKLTIAFGLLFLSMIASGLGTWYALDRIEATSQRMAHTYAPQIERMSDAQVLMFRISLEARHLMLVDTDAERQETLGRIVQFREEKLAKLAEVEANLTTDEGRAILARIRAADVTFWRMAQEVAGKAMAGDSAGAFAQLESELVDARNAVLKPIGEQRAWQDKIMERAIADSQQAAWIAKVSSVSASLVVLLIVAVMVWRIMSMMNGAFRRARLVTSEIAAGRLDGDVYVRGGDEFGDLFESIVAMKNRLHSVVEDVRVTSNRVVGVATRLDETNQSLSSLTQEQLASIESTSQAANAMSDAVDRSAQSVAHVNTLADSAAKIATQGGQVVEQVTQEMTRIEEASKRISEIVTVIDGIAFQTNILALNAAVEAARAGEQGRGFAVVAGEVRSLAQRSAQAAKEVKGLIETSSERVRTGSAAASEAGATMQRVVAAVGELSQQMGSIAAAIGEQRSGARTLDGVTDALSATSDRSAQAIEESRDLARSLRSQADDLERSLQAFKV